MVIIEKIIRFAINAPANYKQATRKINSYSIGSSADLGIVIHNEQSTYTSGDEIRGEVILDLKQEIDVAEVVVKYKVEESTSIRTTKRLPQGPEKLSTESTNPSQRYDRRMVRKQQRFERRLLRAEQKQQRHNNEHVYHSEGKVYSQEVRVFPSPQEYDAIQAKKLTLAPGSHHFPFTIRLPGHPEDGFKMLQPSFQDSRGNSITHTLKATVKRSSNVKQNNRAEVPITFAPAMVPAQVKSLQTISRNFETSTGSFVEMVAEVPVTMELGAKLPVGLTLATNENKPLVVHGVYIELFENLNIKAGNQRNALKSSAAVYTRRDISASGSFIDLSPFLEDINVTQGLTPSFQSNHISLGYCLSIGVRVSSNTRGEDAQMLTLEHTIPTARRFTFPTDRVLAANTNTWISDMEAPELETASSGESMDLMSDGEGRKGREYRAEKF